ncbi:MAG TPA: HAMP domain-containing protein [Candidatus Rifleibacterium sp.]|nr:HAMP domain-containing protein [Candidatus Rifleibacterium sp.]
MIDGKFSAWLKLMAATVILPLVIFWAGGAYLASLARDLRFKNFEIEADETLATMRSLAETEKYLCSSLNSLFNRQNGPAEMAKAIEDYARQHRLKMRHLVWNADGDIVQAGFPYEKQPGNWKSAYLELRKIINEDYMRNENDIPGEIMANMRTVFGPHFFPFYSRHCYAGRELRLIRPDSTQKYPLTWLRTGPNFGLAVFFEYDVLNSLPGLRLWLDNHRGNVSVGLLSDAEVFCHNPLVANELSQRKTEFRHSYTNRQILPGHYIFTRFIDSELTGFCTIGRNAIDQLATDTLTRTVMLLLHFFLGFYAILSYRVTVLQTRISLKIRSQLLLLFAVASILPGFLLFVSGSDYLQQLRVGLLNRAFNRSLTRLQDVDELFNHEFTVQKGRIGSALARLQKSLKQNHIDRNTIYSFLGQQQPGPDMFLLTASNTGIIVSEVGLMLNSSIKEVFNPRLAGDSTKVNVMKAIFKLSVYIMSVINKTPISDKTATEVEFIADGLMQKKPAELIGRFYTRGTFWHWGIGQIRHPTFIENFSLFDPALVDYLMLYVWDSRNLELEFVRRIFGNIRSSAEGITIMATNELMTRVFPPEALEKPELVEFMHKLRDQTLTRPEFCRIDGKDYLLAGHKCVHMPTIRLFSLFPLEKIATEISGKKYTLLLLALVSLLLSVSLGLRVASGILQPLAELQSGIGELQRRNLAYRLPDLGHDEFGSLARIFNEIIVDFEEMHVASIVQEKLMTRLEKPVNAGDLSIYGKIISASGNGGDYFEIFETPCQKTAVLLGTVAGTGISRCLLLAFLRSAALQLRHLTDQPIAFMHGLQEILKNSSAGDSHHEISLMLLLPAAEKEIIIANAGMRAPMILDHASRRVETVELNSVAITAAGNQQPAITTIKLDSRQSLLCFTGTETAVNSAGIADTENVPPETLIAHLAGHLRADSSTLDPDQDLTIVAVTNICQSLPKTA